jgi:hypothetical protein
MKLSRRNIVIGAAGALASGSTLPGNATTKYSVASDPVVILGAIRRKLYDRAAALSTALDNRRSALKAWNEDRPELRADETAVQRAWDAVTEVEKKMAETVATTPAGIAEQAETMRDFVSLAGDGSSEEMLDLIIAGLKRLSRGGAA